MATRNLLVFKTQFDSINTWFLQELLYKHMSWLVGSLRLFLCNYVPCLFGMILNFIARFQEGGDGKPESCCEIDGLREEFTNFLFQSYEDVFEDFGIGEEKTQGSSFMETISDVHEESDGETENPVLMKVHSEFHEDEKKEGETERFVSMEVCSDSHEDEEKKEETGNQDDGNKSEVETDCSVSMEVHSNSHENKERKTEADSFVPEAHFDETEESVSKEVQFDYAEDGNRRERKPEHSDSQEYKRKEGETESSVSEEADSDFYENEGKQGERKSSVLMEHDINFSDDEKESEGERSCVLMETNSATTTQKYQYVCGRNISGFIEEPTSTRFTSREFFVGPNVPAISDNNSFSNTEIIAQEKESPERPKEEDEEDVESAEENKFLGCKNAQEGFESESLKATKEERAAESGKKPEGKDGKERSNEEDKVHKAKTEEWKKMIEELEYDVGNEWRLEWEHDDIVEQLKIELRNARQGGLPTILEEENEEEEQEEETEYLEEFEDQKPEKSQKNEEFKDQMDEIEEIYHIYEEKMRKLDILNYQTMHALGLLQLKDSAPSSFTGVKPLISQNLWPRKEPKTPLMKLVQELQRDLELVYVGQVCLSWEILCWLHKKALQLKQYHHPQADPPQFNIAAGEFQLFQVLLQRFIENEAFQGPRTLNFVKNRCVIRNLLQVPPIRDDGAKEKNITKGDEDYVVSSGRLAEIIKESMWLFWKFVRADKEDGSLILRVSQQTRTDPRDPAISDLLKDIRTHLHKKEKRLKDLVRTGNCIVRKFQKHQLQHEDQLNHEQLLAQVELKLVSRVLNLSKLRKDHLIWCNEKLRKVKFVKKKVLVEPSFLLFPC